MEVCNLSLYSLIDFEIRVSADENKCAENYFPTDDNNFTVHH